jgi:hypothetical protein
MRMHSRTRTSMVTSNSIPTNNTNRPIP